MKNKILRSIGIFIVLILLLYGGVAFVTLEANPIHWSEGNRVLFTFFTFSICVISPLLGSLEFDN